MGERENSDDESKACEQNSEGENSASKELIVVTSKGKKRANRGSATDPQSLYARVHKLFTFFMERWLFYC